MSKRQFADTPNCVDLTPQNLREHAELLRRRSLHLVEDGYNSRFLGALNRCSVLLTRAAAALEAVSPSAREERSADRTPTRPDGESRMQDSNCNQASGGSPDDRSCNPGHQEPRWFRSPCECCAEAGGCWQKGKRPDWAPALSTVDGDPVEAADAPSGGAPDLREHRPDCGVFTYRNRLTGRIDKEMPCTCDAALSSSVSPKGEQ
jgi:hypothetical protein